MAAPRPSTWAERVPTVLACSQTASSATAEAAPLGPNITRSTAPPSVSMVSTKSAWSAASAGESASAAPWSARDAARSRVRFQTRTANPAASSRRATAPPMIPVPRTATVLLSLMWLIALPRTPGCRRCPVSVPHAGGAGEEQRKGARGKGWRRSARRAGPLGDLGGAGRLLAARLAGGGDGWGDGDVAVLHHRVGQEHVERGAAAVALAHPGAAAVELGEAGHQREADADAGGLLGGVGALAERLEDRAGQLRRHAGAGVLDHELEVAPADQAADPHRRARRGVPGRVDQQVLQDALDLGAVDVGHED